MFALSSTSGRPSLKEQRFGVNPNILILILWLAATVAMALPAMKSGIFDAMATDDATRLVQVRDLINGQGWFDLFQYRLDPPGGTSMHWTRVIDVPLAALILLLRPLIGTHAAEAATLFLWPTLLFAAALVLVAAIARQLSGGVMHAQALAVMLAALSAPALVHFRAGAIDHHNAQIDLLLALVLLTSQIEQSLVKAALAGLMASLSLAIGIEMLPAIAAIGLAVFGLFVLRGAILSRQIFSFGSALAGSSLLLATALLPLPSLALPVCDTLGGPVLLLTAGGGMSLVIMVAVDRYHSTMSLRLITGTASAIALVIAFLSSFSECIASPYAQLDPLVMSIWADQVAESISLAKSLQLSPQKVLGFYGFAMMTMGFASAALIKCAPAERFRWIVGTVTLAALVGLGVWEVRAMAAASMVAAPLLAASLTVLWPTLATGRSMLLAFAMSPVSLGLLGLSAKPLIYAIFQPQMAIAEDAPRCDTVSDVVSLAQLPKGRVMAPIDLGPAILANTDHDIFAAPYHRNNDGILAMLELMLAPVPTARQILWDRRVDYVVVCTAAPEKDFVSRAPDGLRARLRRGEIPDFLEPLDVDPTHKISVWRVRR